MNATILETKSFDLTNFSAPELERLWRQHLRQKVPEHLPKSLLARLLAYRLQVEQQGGLSKKAIAYLKVMEINLRDGVVTDTPYPEDQKLKPGCQLLREHEGVNHRVTVVAGGYEWNGRTFASLSSVAKAITGTNWNGNRFFGLKAKLKLPAQVFS